jgi:predicted ATPase
MGAAIKQVTIEGFKSIQKLENFELRNLNVLIGANGAGKSNFVELFRLLRAMADENLQAYVAKSGGGDGFFFQGPKRTPKLNVQLAFGSNEYKFTLEPTLALGSPVVVTLEAMKFTGHADAGWRTLRSGRPESALRSRKNEQAIGGPWAGVGHYVYESVSTWTVYHFHDTGSLAPMRREQSIEDTAYLRPDASNIASFMRLMREQHGEEYGLIRDTIRLVAPFFDDFLLKERVSGNERKVSLDWQQKGSDFPFQAWHLSDGTIRFICLATALLQPDPPPTIVIDEPELGLHPYALEVLAGLLQKAAARTQVIVSTQSAPLLSQFEPEDVITVSRKDGASVFSRLNQQALAEWLKDYTLGELWQKNVVEAGATND